jgi:predicted flap endonuclease-1-like 5' DNA nuclease
MAVLRKLNTIQNELGSAPREVQARGSAPQSPSGVGPASHVVDDFETLSGAAADQAAGFNDTGRSMPQPETPQPAMLQQRIWVRQLKLIPGLGAASARRLIEAGINDIHELATLTEGRLAALATDFPKIRDWTGAAAAIEQLCGIRLVSQANAAELLKSGVHSRTQLRGLSDDEIQSLSESLPQIREWVEAAKLAAAGNDSEENASVSDAERSGAGGEASDAGQEESSRDGAASDN